MQLSSYQLSSWLIQHLALEIEFKLLACPEILSATSVVSIVSNQRGGRLCTASESFDVEGACDIN